MSTIPSYLPVAPQPAGAAPSQAVIPAPPPGLTRLAAGALIDGTVVGRTQQGLLAIKTSHGELALRTSASPPVQSRVVLQLQPSGGQFRVILLTAEGVKSSPGAPAQKAPSQPGGQQASPPPPVSTLQARAAPPPAGAPQLPQAQPSAQPAVGVKTGYPAAPVTPSGAASQPVASQPGTPQPGATQPIAPQSQNTAAPLAGQALPVAGRPAAPPVIPGSPSMPTSPSGVPVTTPTSPPGAAATTPPPGAALQSITNTPTGTPAIPTATPGAATVATPGAGTLATGPASAALSPTSPPTMVNQAGQVATQSTAAPTGATGALPALPAATTLSSAGLPLAVAAGAPSVGPAIAGAGGAELIRNWPGLDLAIAALRAASPQLAAPNIDAVMPRPGPQLAGTLALLVSALRGGDIRGWLGKTTMRELTRTSGKEAAGRLADEFGQLSRLARTDSGEWRVQALPFFDGARLQQIQLYIKRRDQGASGDEDVPARFVFEFDLSNLGPVQLDGLAANRRFDLVVRSQSDLPDAIRKEIGAMFSRSQEENGFAGEIHFQTAPTFAVAPLGEVQANTSGLVV